MPASLLVNTGRLVALPCAALHDLLRLLCSLRPRCPSRNMQQMVSAGFCSREPCIPTNVTHARTAGAREQEGPARAAHEQRCVRAAPRRRARRRARGRVQKERRLRRDAPPPRHAARKGALLVCPCCVSALTSAAQLVPTSAEPCRMVLCPAAQGPNSCLPDSPYLANHLALKRSARLPTT
jgi:hypothetical protein